jgi:cytidine deaminase
MADMERLLRAAARVRKNAWAPYSNFQVGAAVLAGGRVYAGCNVENSSYPLSVCAERNAVAAAVAAGQKRIEAVAIVGGAARPSAPCGGCRQVLSELAGEETPVVYASPGGPRETTTLGALLPASFGADDLEAAPKEAGASKVAAASGASKVAAAGVRGAAAESTGTSRARPGKRRSGLRPRGTRSSGQSRSR